MSTVDTISLITPSRNPYLEGFNFGIASATAKGELLRQMLTQISGNTADIKTLRAAADILSTATDWDSLTEAQKFQVSQAMDVADIDHPLNGAYVSNVTLGNLTFPANVYVSYPPTDLRPNSSSFLQPPPYNVTTLQQGLYTLSDGTFYSPGPGNLLYKVDPQTLQTYTRTSPVQSDELKDDLLTSAQDKTQIGQGQQIAMQQIIADKSMFELAATGVLQRLDSLFRDLISKLG